MQTPWGELAVVDAHLHFFSHRFYSLLATQLGEGETAESACGRLGWPTPPESPVVLAREWVRELSRHGVDRSVLMASLCADHESVARAVAAEPDRFYGYFLLDPMAPDALYALENALAAGLRGLMLFPAMHHFSVGEEGHDSIFRRMAKQRGAIVMVHCGVLSVGVRNRLGLASRFDMRYSNPVDLHPLASRYPEIPFVIPHFGAGYFREALMVASLCPNVYLDTSSTNSWMRMQTENLTLETVFGRALDVLGPKRLLFGTDSSYFPRGWHRAVFDKQVQTLEKLGVSVEEAAAILGGNLRHLLG